MSRLFIESKLEKVTYILEIAITILIAIGIFIGLIDLVKYFGELLRANVGDTYELFEGFLAYALLLIVGIELILMILYHSTEAILELVLFVIARKMLIYSHTMLDLVLGTLAIAIVFATLKYLVEHHEKDIVKRDYFSYDGSADVDEVISTTGFNIPNKAHKPTIADLVNDLAEKKGLEIEEGMKITSGNAVITVTKANSKGDVKEVRLTERNVTLKDKDTPPAETVPEKQEPKKQTNVLSAENAPIEKLKKSIESFKNTNKNSN